MSNNSFLPFIAPVDQLFQQEIPDIVGQPNECPVETSG